MPMTSRRLVLAVLVAAVAAGGSALAQTPAPPQQSAAAAGAKPAQVPPPEPPAYTYEPEGRRDPFVSLLLRGSDPGSAVTRPPGLPGLLINEVTVKGIVRDRNGFIAMIQGPDTKTFNVRPGDRLMDGSVKSISGDTVVFSQDVNDPLSLVKEREVRKAVRPADGGRG
jgi:Tfp pilus assembly protein PilP